ncbi:AIPR family protein [Paenibacillus illinoisensis]|uniref:AIPR family protein n=1 Tax=Paenibacillus illinoisensis TaxID=59845 RepID=UPI0034C0D639
MDNDLIVFSHEFQQQVLLSIQNSDEENLVNCFTEYMLNCLIEDGSIEDGIPLYYRKSGMQINGYSYVEELGILNLFVSQYNAASPPVNVRFSDADSAINRLFTFLKKTIGGVNNNIEKGKPLNDFCLKIFEVKESLSKINLYFLTDGVLKKTWDKELSLDNIETEVHIWDLERLFRNITSGQFRESIEIDFEKLGGSIACLEMPEKNATYESYLAIFPASLLVDIYGKYRNRLLEGNVRSFLQIRGNVNKGIRETIKTEPHMFLAYNNGISAVAESVEFVRSENGLRLQKVRDFQIVNGGQTTATLYQVYRKDRVSLRGVSVQLKLTVVSDPAKMRTIVPKISEYANSQNKIQTADFSSNHPYHRTLEELSRIVWAPVKRGQQRQTKWFYERVRGQYLVDRGKENTLTFKRNFDAEFPKSQKFEKTDLAKYVNTWHQKPYLVSRGIQKNFNEFMDFINKENIPLPVQSDFEKIIALAILYKKAEQLINEQKQSYPAYRSYVVAYSLAWISYVTDREIDLNAIWRAQDIPTFIIESLKYIFPIANQHITNAPGNGNITEWCKKKECWEAFIRLDIDIPDSLLG